jgi:hypothetical protein
VEGHIGPAGDLNGNNSSELVEVSVGEGGELVLDGLEQAYGDVEAGVGAVGLLGGVLHGAEGAAGLGGDIEGAGGVPGEAEHERGAVLLGDEAAELALGLVDGLEVVLAQGGVALGHGWTGSDRLGFSSYIYSIIWEPVDPRKLLVEQSPPLDLNRASEDGRSGRGGGCERGRSPPPPIIFDLDPEYSRILLVACTSSCTFHYLSLSLII